MSSSGDLESSIEDAASGEDILSSKDSLDSIPSMKVALVHFHVTTKLTH